MRYRTLVLDPPWKYDRFVSFSGTRASRRPLPYPSMTLSEIGGLPVPLLASRDCWLWLWTTTRYLGSAHWLLGRWGFKYAATVVWHKTGGVSPFTRSRVSMLTDAEFLLAAVRGSPGHHVKFPSLVIEAPRVGDHSQKPEVFLDLIEAFGDAPRLEMFARRQRLGWDTWGNQALEHVSLDALDAAS